LTAEFLKESEAMNEPRIDLPISEMPRRWYNLAADLPQPPPPPLGPDGNPIGPDALAPVFPMNLIEQEVSAERWIDPGGNSRHLRPMAAVAAATRLRPRKAPRDACQDLLQGRERFAGGQPQAQHGRRPGLVQQGVF
jgi:hypothetical protein